MNGKFRRYNNSGPLSSAFSLPWSYAQPWTGPGTRAKTGLVGLKQNLLNSNVYLNKQTYYLIEIREMFCDFLKSPISIFTVSRTLELESQTVCYIDFIFCLLSQGGTQCLSYQF